jgi:hypothetical protein
VLGLGVRTRAVRGRRPVPGGCSLRDEVTQERDLVRERIGHVEGRQLRRDQRQVESQLLCQVGGRRYRTRVVAEPVKHFSG